MNILKELSIRNLILNKKRTISTIIGIILSCSLICAVATLFTSFRETLVQSAINNGGYYHFKIANVTESDIGELRTNKDIEDIFVVNQDGYGILKDSKNEYKPYLKLYSMNQDVFNQLSLKIVEGRFPNSDNEVIISKHIIENAEVEYKIGDKINIDIGKRESLDGSILNSNDLYDKDEEHLVDLESKEFTIVRDNRKTRL